MHDPAEATIITDTHIYSVLPVDQWQEAAQLIVDLVGPDAAIPTPEIASLLAARSLDTGKIEGVLFVQSVFLVDRFACIPKQGVSYTAFHDLVRSIFGADGMYYTTVCNSPRAIEAADRAGLAVYELLALPKSLIESAGTASADACVGVVGGEDAVVAESDGGDIGAASASGASGASGS